MSAKHTEGKLVVDPNGSEWHDDISTEQGLMIAGNVNKLDARRLAACWNAFLPVSTEDIESLGGLVLYKGEPVGELAAAQALQTQLVEALKQIAGAQAEGCLCTMRESCEVCSSYPAVSKLRDIARVALDAAGGTK